MGSAPVLRTWTGLSSGGGVKSTGTMLDSDCWIVRLVDWWSGAEGGGWRAGGTPCPNMAAAKARVTSLRRAYQKCSGKCQCQRCSGGRCLVWRNCSRTASVGLVGKLSSRPSLTSFSVRVGRLETGSALGMVPLGNGSGRGLTAVFVGLSGLYLDISFFWACLEKTDTEVESFLS